MGEVKVKLNLSNYATKAGLKVPTTTDISNVALKTDLDRLKQN